jgi:hypothetical protein
MLYVPARFDIPEAEDDFDDEEDPELPLGTQPARRRGGRQTPTQIKRLPVLHGSFHPDTLTFSADETDYSLKATLAPARTKCLCCGGTAGSRNVITPVSLGTSAALKVMTEGLFEALDETNRDRPDHDAKERLLIFSDSRQDAAHQARFILFASRYDRMRRAVVRLLDQHGALSIQRTVELLGEAGVQEHDNPCVLARDAWIPEEELARIRAWEEAPLLDDLAVTTGYRASLVNLGLVGVRYHRLDEYIHARGNDLATTLGIALEAQPFQYGHLFARSLAVETCLPFSYGVRSGGFFLGPRGCFWYRESCTDAATSRNASANARAESSRKNVQDGAGIAILMPS